MEEADVSRYSNWKNLAMLNHFLRSKVLGVTLIGSAVLEEVDVYMHHPAESSLHKFFFTNRLRSPPRADKAGAKARGGYWLGTGQRELIKEIDGTSIGSKEQLVFNEGKYIKCSKRTKWCLNEYMIFGDQSLKRNDLINDGNKKKESWILCELFQKDGAEDKEGGEHNSGLLPLGLRASSSKKMPHLAPSPEACPVLSPTLAGEQPSEGISGIEELDRTSSGSYDGDWKEKRVEDYTSKDHDDFLAFMEECVNNPPDWEYWGLES